MKDTQKTIIAQGFELLQQLKNYRQTAVVRKIKGLGFNTSEASLSNILKGKKAGLSAYWENAEGMKKLVEMECCFQWDDPSRQYLPLLDCTPVEVPEWTGQAQSGVVFHDKGRLSIEEKVRFFSTAQHEMVEFGLTLNTFTSYFLSRKEEDFKKPIHELLKRGVQIKCYLLDPESNEARLYFDDRAKFHVEEREGTGKIKTSLANFKIILREIEACQYAGKMEVYTYKHIPHQYMLAIDRKQPDGKFHVSHYLFSELRARCPVIECARKNNPTLFIRYNASLENLMKGAKKIDI